MIKEACVESLAQAINAERKGADRIELCSDLANDGLTPDFKLIESIRKQVNIPVRIMVRPRKGDFCYSDSEFATMKDTIDFCKDAGVEGVVFGFCRSDDTLNVEAISDLAINARPLKVTIHKAIDVCGNPLNEIKELISLNLIDSVLTSGGKRTAFEGVETLKSMISLADGKIEIIVCGKVTDTNLVELHHQLQAPAYHGKLIVGTI